MKKLLHTKALVVKENISQDGVIDAVVGSTNVLDRMGDIIDQNGWDLKAFKTNPVILWGHNVKEERPPIGKALKVWIEDKGNPAARLMFRVQLDLLDQFAAEIFRKINAGFINTVSVGFLPSKWEELDPDNWFGGLKYLAQELLELSFVPVPANPEAIVSLRSFAAQDKRFTPTDEKELYPALSREEMAKMLHKELQGEEIPKDDVIKPYENEHACRLRNPDDFQDDSFRSSSRKHEGKEYRVIMGRLKSEDTMTEQAYRYNKSTWTADEARSHCTSHDGTFEAAKKEEEITEKKDMSDYLDKMSDRVGQMSELHKKMTDDASKIFEGQDVKDIKEVAKGDIQKMQDHSEDVSGLCDSMIEAMGKEKLPDETKVTQNAGMLEKIGVHIGGMEKLQEKMTGDNGEEGKEVSEGDIASMKKHAQGIGGLCEDMMGMMDEGEEGKKVDDKDEFSKAVIPFKDLGTLPESEGWDGPGEIAKAEVADLKIICTWYDSEKADDKGSYKLPHHKADGEYKAVWRGVAAAMAALLGAKGGAGIPEGDRQGVYNHLVEHYKQFDKEVPDYNMVENQILAGLDEELLALTLDREDKHVVRLVKKVLDNGKKEQSSIKEVIGALKVLNLALGKVNIQGKGVNT